MRISDWSSDVCSSDLASESPSRRALPSDACGVPRLPCLCRHLRHSQLCQRSCSITPMTSLPLCSAHTSISMSIYLGVSPDVLDRVAPLYNLLFHPLAYLNVRDLPHATTPHKILDKHPTA